MKIEMILEKETKGAVRYEEPERKGGDPNYLIGTLYLRKAYLKEKGLAVLPPRIWVTVSEE